MVACSGARRHVRADMRRKQAVRALASVPSEPAATPAEDLEGREHISHLRTAVVSLPPKLREAYVFVYMEGIPGREVAELLGVHEGTIWKRLHLARARLEAALEGAL